MADSGVEIDRIQYYVWPGGSLGRFVVGRVTVPAATIELVFGIAGGGT